ncbi:MAG: TonB-dependent receptor [Flavobacteriales bacterium]|nr:TonB-dependent receptor [Flavobacteriales bacterium]
MNRTYFITILWIVFGFDVKAQNDSIRTGKLREVVIEGSRTEQFNSGGRVDNTDTFIRRYFNQHSIAELLNASSGINIRNYGPGVLATTSLRGSSSQQVNLVWNGFTLNNQASGLIDLSLIPTFLFDEISLLPGLPGSLQGSGTVAGGISLKNSKHSGKTTYLKYSGMVNNSLNTANGLELKYSLKNTNHKTSVFYQTFKNRFKYKNRAELNFPTETMVHSNGKNLNFMHETNWELRKSAGLNFGIWTTASDQQIPPTMLETTSESNQEDRSTKMVLSYQKNRRNYLIHLKSYGQFDKIRYSDQSLELFSLINTNLFQQELDVNLKTGKYGRGLVGLGHTYTNTNSSTYSKSVHRQTFSIWYNQYLHTKNKRFRVDLTLKQDVTDGNRLPLIPGLALNYRMTKNSRVFGQINRVYRIPTLNDLYWHPGGNPMLKPESGIAMEGTLEKGIHTKNIRILCSLTAYYRELKNQIIWLPVSTQVWSPQNIGKVENSGIEGRLSLLYRFSSDASLNLSLNTDYSKSTNKNRDDPNFNKQLIYIPLYRINFFAGLKYSNIHFQWQVIKTDKRYTSPDNEDFLTEFILHNVFLGYTFTGKKSKGELFLKYNNLFNENYETIAWRPMPLSNVELGIQLELNFNQKNDPKQK